MQKIKFEIKFNILETFLIIKSVNTLVLVQLTRKPHEVFNELINNKYIFKAGHRNRTYCKILSPIGSD